MKLFKCQACSNLLYFENTSCEVCKSTVGYLPQLETISVVEPAGANWIAAADPAGQYRFCANWELRACNWLVPVGDEPYCLACQHNKTIPDISNPTNHALWTTMEIAKRRLFYSLLKLKLPLPRPGKEEGEALVFEFLSDTPNRKIMTGHDNGHITISLREADDAVREKMRTNLHEPYRTLLGHFRHEVGHFYWDRLVSEGGQLGRCRAVFGDDSVDYQAALQHYYEAGPPPDWQQNYVSAYATMHPWEDFAETWAHHLHIVDTLEMAYAFGLKVAPRVADDTAYDAQITVNPYRFQRVEELVEAWLPVTFAVNSLNRTMGQPDLYPFIVTPAVMRKLDFIRTLVIVPS